MISVIHEQLHHDLQRRPLTLQERRDCHQSLDQIRAERVHLPEHRPVSLARKQDVNHCLADLRGFVERIVELLARRFRLWLEDVLALVVRAKSEIEPVAIRLHQNAITQADADNLAGVLSAHTALAMAHERLLEKHRNREDGPQDQG